MRGYPGCQNRFSKQNALNHNSLTLRKVPYRKPFVLSFAGPRVLGLIVAKPYPSTIHHSFRGQQGHLCYKQSIINKKDMVTIIDYFLPLPAS